MRHKTARNSIGRPRGKKYPHRLTINLAKPEYTTLHAVANSQKQAPATVARGILERALAVFP